MVSKTIILLNLKMNLMFESTDFDGGLDHYKLQTPSLPVSIILNLNLIDSFLILLYLFLYASWVRWKQIQRFIFRDSLLYVGLYTIGLLQTFGMLVFDINLLP